jgi:hypothetical protein
MELRPHLPPGRSQRRHGGRNERQAKKKPGFGITLATWVKSYVTLSSGADGRLGWVRGLWAVRNQRLSRVEHAGKRVLEKRAYK